MLTLEALRLIQDDFSLTADLTLPTGRLAALIGPSGAGKSTLLAAISGFFNPTGGRVLWNGQDITHLPPGDRPVSILFQDNNLFPHLTVDQNVGLGLAPRLRLSSDERARVAEILALTGLTGLGDRKPAALSGGQQSRAALARTLLSGRPVVLLDEPFSALGPGLKDEMLDLAASLLRAAGRTLLMVTHDPDDAVRIADDIILVADGKAAPPVHTKDLLAHPPEVLRRYLGKTGFS
jgi:thiamine transport system ATP-binding protein